jgi:hypothetical protein
MILDPANDRLIVRVADADVNRQTESWWSYRLSTAKPAGRMEPRRLMADPKPARFIVDARPVAGTPLILIHWWRHREERGEDTVGARFTLVDLKGKPVWRLELPKDYSIPGNEEAEDRLRDEISDSGAILRADQQGQFELRFVAEAKRVTFAVEADAKAGWLVRELARKPYVPIVRTKEWPTSIPRKPLQHLGSITLRALRQAADPLREIEAVTVDQRGRIYAAAAGTAVVHVFDSSGRQLYVCRPDRTDFGPRPGLPDVAVADSGDLYLTVSDKKDQHLHFSPEGKRLGFESLGLDTITECLRYQPGNSMKWVVGYETIWLVEGKNKVSKTIERRPDGTWLQHLDPAVVGADGSLAIMAGWRPEVTLNVYRRNGQPERTVRLALSFSANGGSFAYDGERFVISDASRILLLDRSGRPLQQLVVPGRRDGDPQWELFLVAAKRELWFFDWGCTIHRYAMP